MDKTILEQIDSTAILVALYREMREKFAMVPKLQIKMNRLEFLNTRLGESAEKYTNARNGIAQSKSAARLRLEADCLLCGFSIHVYAKDEGRHDFLDATDISASWVSSIRDAELGLLGQTIAKIGADIGKPLEDYGVTQELTAELKTAADAFATAKTATKETISGKHGVRATITADLNEENDLLDSIERLMIHFKEKDPGFYAAYKDASRFRKYSVRHRPETPNAPPDNNTPEKPVA